jgi:hypothetical protein
MDHQPILQLFRANTHGTEFYGNRPNPIRFLDPELRGILNAGPPFCTRGGHGEHRDLVNQAWDEVSPNAHPFQGARSNPQTGTRLLDPPPIAREDLDRAPHCLEGLEKARPGRIHPDPLDGEIGIGENQAGYEKKGSRGKIPRNCNPASPQ